MPRKATETRRRSKRLNQGQASDPEEVPDSEEEGKPGPYPRGSMIPTPRNPIRGSSRIPRSSRVSRMMEEEEEEEEEVVVTPQQIITKTVPKILVEKMKLDPPVVVEEKKEEEEEEEEEVEEVVAPLSIEPRSVPKLDLRPTMSSLQKLREKLPERPERRIPQSEMRRFSATQPRPQGGQTWTEAACSWWLCSLGLVLLGLVLGGWLLLGPGTLPRAWVPVKELKMEWISSIWLGQQETCQDQCSLTLVESIPVGLLYPEGAPRHRSVSSAWEELLERANRSVDIAAYYLTLRARGPSEGERTAAEGRRILEGLAALSSRGIRLKVAVNSPQQSPEDTDYLVEKGAEVRGVCLKNLTGGIVHTKLWVVDGEHVYLGSANMDWRSLTQVKELGVVLSNCSCLARDLERVFAVYWSLGAQGASLPGRWSAAYAALSSRQRPLHLTLNGLDAQVYVSSAPPPLCGAGRTGDLDAILDVIDDAREFVFVSVMDFLPLCKFCDPQRYWPAIEDRLRAAACERGVTIRLLVSCWPHTYAPMLVFLEALDVLRKEPLKCRVEVKIFRVPATPEQERIPFGRVNHNKYMVTDRVAYIGTSNWSEDYFIRTAGVGLVINQTGVEKGNPGTVQSQLKAVFQRDWDSDHTLALGSEGVKECLRSGGSQ